MNAGGRVEMYNLMGMEPPVLKVKKKKKVVPLVIDRTGESDPARYSGLKMGQVLDDDAMAKALEEAIRKTREGKDLRAKLEEETFVKPFAGEKMRKCVKCTCSPFVTAEAHSHSLSFLLLKIIATLVRDKRPIGQLKN